MESHPYSYGTKLTGLILHLFFTVVLTIAVFLLASMLSKNIFELSDVGTEQFLDSGYYTKCIEKKCDDLSDYLRLLIKGESRTSEENRRYLQYTNEFKSGDSNFCYCYRIGEAWYTNQPDTKEGQEFDVEAVLMEAKTMGNYLIYDLVDKEFGTDINGMADYFFGGGNQMLWPADDMTLIIGIDTELSAEDDIYEASREYEQLHPWIKVCIFCGLVSLMGWIISLVYLTLATGRRTGEEKIHLNPIDKIKTAINTVSSVRGDLGATQNRLDHTINNLSVMTENIQDAESTIRDTDVADEMMAYTKNNILIQSAQAMLAQANQVPQGVLQLLQ